MTKKELEQRLEIRRIVLELNETDTRTLDEKLEDLELAAEEFKDREAGREVERLIGEAKKEGGSDKAMFEDPEGEKPFKWDEIGEID